MPLNTLVTIRGKVVKVPVGTKSDIARALLDQGYTVSEISKAVPMAYSQVHSIWKKEPAGRDAHGPTTRADRNRWAKAGQAAMAATPTSPWGDLPNTRKSTKPQKAKTLSLPRVGKLRTPGLPSDIDVGPCANCGHDLIVRGGPTGYLLVHVNTTAEEYLAVTQFCNAVPQVLMA